MRRSPPERPHVVDLGRTKDLGRRRRVGAWLSKWRRECREDERTLVVLVVGAAAVVGVSAMAAGQRAAPLASMNLARLTIVPTGVYLKSVGPSIWRLTADGQGEIEDRFALDGTTGRQVPVPNARAADEITLAVGETCRVGVRDEWHILHLVRVVRRSAVFLHTGRRDDGRAIHETIRLDGSR